MQKGSIKPDMALKDYSLSYIHSVLASVPACMASSKVMKLQPWVQGLLPVQENEVQEARSLACPDSRTRACHAPIYLPTWPQHVPIAILMLGQRRSLENVSILGTQPEQMAHQM